MSLTPSLLKKFYVGDIDKSSVKVEKVKAVVKDEVVVKGPSIFVFVIPVILAAGFAYYNMVLKHQ